MIYMKSYDQNKVHIYSDKFTLIDQQTGLEYHSVICPVKRVHSYAESSNTLPDDEVGDDPSSDAAVSLLESLL